MSRRFLSGLAAIVVSLSLATTTVFAQETAAPGTAEADAPRTTTTTTDDDDDGPDLGWLGLIGLLGLGGLMRRDRHDHDHREHRGDHAVNR